MGKWKLGKLWNESDTQKNATKKSISLLQDLDLAFISYLVWKVVNPIMGYVALKPSFQEAWLNFSTCVFQGNYCFVSKC
jgi:hypothetical protein